MKINSTNLSKEEIKSIKKGLDYKTWNRRRRIVVVVSLIWTFGGIPLVHINRVTSAIYSIGLLLCLITLFYSIVITCWKCPSCKSKLPSRDVCGGTVTISMPIIVRKCPHCGLDLAQQFVEGEKTK